MAKNIVHLHERVKFWLDITRTPRFKTNTIDNAINIAVNDILINRFKPSIEADTQQKNLELKGFQRSNQLRDELKPLVKVTSAISPSTNVLVNADLPADYGYHTLFEWTLTNGMIIYSTPITQEKLDIIQKDPYKRLKDGEAIKIYHIEQSDGFRFISSSWGKSRAGATITGTVKVYYLAKPTDVFYGFEKLLSAVGVGVTAIVTQETATILATDKKIGDEIPYNAGNSTNTCKVVTGYINLALPEILFDEVAKLAANHLISIVSRTAQISQ